MVTRTTISLEEELHKRVARLLKYADKRLNPLVNDLLREWAAEQERQRYREELRGRFRKALSYRDNITDVDELEKEWAEVDEESARALDNLP
jgi:hypothetical protein